MPSVDVEWRSVRVWLALFILQVYLVTLYFLVTPTAPTDAVRYLIYPVVWITVGVWAVVAVDPSPGSRRLWGFGVIVSGLYFLLVLWVPGNIGFGTGAAMTSVRVEWYSPGWGPLVAVVSPWVRLFLVPFEVIGYAALAYLVYANVLNVARGTLSGVLGLVTCVGCTVPVLVPVVGMLGGPATSLTTTAYAWSYDLGTGFYLLTVFLLYRSFQSSTA